jgi:hypothetical protein
MIEIIVIWRLVVHIGNDAAQKGLKKLWYQIMAVLLWLCGEFIGGMLGNVIFGTNSSFWPIYVLALLGALMGVTIAFVVIRLVPNQESFSNNNDNEVKQEISPSEKFGRSNWIPILVIVLAVSCLCISFGVAFIDQMRSRTPQINTSNPIIGVEVDSSGQIIRPINEISSKANAIYFSFNFNNPSGREMPITFDWYIDEHIAYSFEKTFSQGQVVVSLDRNEIGLSEFNKGNYKVITHIGESFLTSAKFVVK